MNKRQSPVSPSETQRRSARRPPAGRQPTNAGRNANAMARKQASASGDIPGRNACTFSKEKSKLARTVSTFPEKQRNKPQSDAATEEKTIIPEKRSASLLLRAICMARSAARTDRNRSHPSAAEAASEDGKRTPNRTSSAYTVKRKEKGP